MGKYSYYEREHSLEPIPPIGFSRMSLVSSRYGE